MDDNNIFYYYFAPSIVYHNSGADEKTGTNNTIELLLEDEVDVVIGSYISRGELSTNHLAAKMLNMVVMHIPNLSIIIPYVTNSSKYVGESGIK